jgi:hypothetical protein
MFWDITQRRVVIVHGRFGKMYQPRFEWSRRPKRNLSFWIS